MRILNKNELSTFILKDSISNREDTLYAIFEFIDKGENFEKELQAEAASILYSKFYWYVQFQNEYTKHHGYDAGIEQCNFKLLERISYNFDIDWNIVEQIVKNQIKEGDIF